MSYPESPYYAVIFTSELCEEANGYAQMPQKMVDMACQQPGFQGMDSARESVGITVSYWRDLGSIQQWKTNLEHQRAQQLGRAKSYAHYTVRIARIERQYEFQKD